jgi:hypothetical protein
MNDGAIGLQGSVPMTTQKVFIGSKTMVEVVCPQCDRSLTISVDKIQNVGNPVRARCACGIQFTVVFERRANYRKPTGLFGRFARKVDSELQAGEIVIDNLSRGGLCMTVPENVKLKVGEVMRIDFRLDNNEQTLIRVQVVIKNIHRSSIGAEFYSLEEHTRKLLSFYLMP